MKNNEMYETINTLARKATMGTLKRIYNASGHDRIRQLRASLYRDFVIVDNNLTCANSDGLKSQIISDAYDCYIVAYEYLLDQYDNGLTDQSEITVTLKNGTEKTRTVYQWACIAVSRYIYQNKSLDTTGKFTYIEDLRTSNQASTDAIDKEYARMGKYDGISTSEDYNRYTDMVQSLNLTYRQLTVVKMRMQGKSISDIAVKLDVTHQAVSKTLKQIQGYVMDQYPDLTRGFKECRKY